MAALAVLLAACAPPDEGPSRVNEAIDNLSFAVPPHAATPTPVSSSTGTSPSAARGLKPQIYLGQGAGALGPQGGAQRVGDGVQINFDGADVKDVVKVILHDILHANYTISPKVAGQVTLSTGAPLQDPDLLTVLETVLRMNGAGLARINGTYVVAPVDELPASAQVVPLGGSSPPALPAGAGVTIVPLRFLAATSAAQFIQPLLRRPEDIRIDPSRNLILFSGSAIERQNVIETLSAIDVDWLAGKSVGIFPLQHATPEALAPELQSLFARPGAGPQGPGEFQPVQFMPVSRLNAILAVASSPQQIREVQQWVYRLDQGGGDGPQFYVYELKHSPAEDMAKLLSDSFGGGQTISGAADQSAPSLFSAGVVPTPGANAGQTSQAGAQGGASDTGSVSSGPGALSGPLQGVKIVANKFNNTLLIRATPQAYEMIEATLARLDTAPLQVLIEATIAEVTLNNALKYGIQYYLHQGNFRAGFNTTANGGLSGSVSPNDLSPLANVPGFNFIFSGGNADVTIDALAQITHVRVLSSPSVVVQDNAEAVLTVGDEVPITTRTAVSVDDPSAPVVNNIEYRNTGVILQVKPRINSDQVVALQIGQEVSRVVNTAQLATNSPTPTIQQRKITSTVDVASGQTVVLGGLIQDSEQRSNGKVPLLGDIPILGPLLGSNTNNSDDRTELIVFITPRVIRDSQDARDISEELRARMRALGSQGFLPAPGTMPPPATVPVTPHGPTPLLPPPVTVRPVTPLPPSSQLMRPVAPVAMAVPVARPTPPPCGLCGGPSTVVASLEPAALRGMHPRPRPIAFRVLAIGPPPPRPELPWGPVEAALRPALAAVM
jgi:general secretion pathway protein D